MSSTRPPATANRPVPSSPAKGIAVVVVAIVIGVIILWRVPRSGGAGGSAKTTTTAVTTTTVGQTTSTAAASMTGVKILVVNAAGVANAASKVANQLKALNLETLPPGNAAQAGANQTSVYFADGFQAQANRVAQILGLPAAVGAIDASLIKGGAQGAQVVVMVGKDMANAASSTTAARGAATTAKPATPTTKAATATTKAATTTTKG
jgi:hypothetical protein